MNLVVSAVYYTFILQTLPPTREYPMGRWFNHTVLKKDNWVRENADNWIAYRIQLELNKTLQSLGMMMTVLDDDDDDDDDDSA